MAIAASIAFPPLARISRPDVRGVAFPGDDDMLRKRLGARSAAGRDRALCERDSRPIEPNHGSIAAADCIVLLGASIQRPIEVPRRLVEPNRATDRVLPACRTLELTQLSIGPAVTDIELTRRLRLTDFPAKS